MTTRTTATSSTTATCSTRCESAITDYTGGALDGYEKQDIEGLLADRLEQGAARISTRRWRRSGRSASRSPRRRDTLQYQQYFCAAEPGNAEQLKANEPKRVELYKAVAAVTRCYGNLANEMEDAGYTAAEAAAIKAEIAHYAAVRDEVKLGAGEDIDFKQYEAGMRFLLDTYIQADASETVADFEDTGLVQLIVQLGAGALDKLPKGIRKDPEAVAETIANNVRKVIIDEHAMNPKYYDQMSELLDALIERAAAGGARLQGLPGAADRPTPASSARASRTPLSRRGPTTAPGARSSTSAARGELAVAVDRAVMQTKPDQLGRQPDEGTEGQAGHRARCCPTDFERLDELFDLMKAQG